MAPSLLPSPSPWLQVPTAPKRDLFRLMNKERIVLRFRCRLLEGEGFRLINIDRWGRGGSCWCVVRGGKQGLQARALLAQHAACKQCLSPFFNPLPFKANNGRCCPSRRERRFVLSFFAADETVSVFEPPVRNSGITGGKYLERAKVRHATLRCLGCIARNATCA